MTAETQHPETQQTDVVRFQTELPPRGLRVNSRAQNRGWRAALTREYAEAVWIAGSNATAWQYNAAVFRGAKQNAVNDMPWEKAHLELVWRHAGVAPDHDNALAACKALIDVLHSKSARPLGIFVDDDPAHLRVDLRTEKVKHRVDECVVVKITRL